MTPAGGNVHPLRPVCMLFVGGVDDGYADDVAAAAEPYAIDLTAIDADDDVHAAARHARADVVIFDAGADLGPTADLASAFAKGHPRTIVAVVATSVDEDRHNDGLLVAHRWRTPERLLDRLMQAYVARSRSRLGPDLPFNQMNAQ